MKFASSVPDFRRPDRGNIRHSLADIIMLMILGRASGHVARSEIIEFGRHNLNRFHKMGMLRNGVPSEATLCRVEQGIDALSMAERMQEFAEVYHARLLKDKAGKEIICVDGKALRGSVLSNGSSPDIVSAYSPSTDITLATEACHEKSNEIKAVPRLIDRIDLAGKILTTDAMSMQKDIIDRIRKKGGDFLIEFKGNQRSLRYGIEDRIRQRSSRSARNLDTIQRIVHSVFSIWRRLRKKRADRRMGMAEIMRLVSASFTKLIRFLHQK